MSIKPPVTLPVTLIIPVKNEAGTIAQLWQSIEAQLVPPVRIVLVDGGSADQTIPLIRQLATADSRIDLIEAGQAMPGEGRNLGIGAAATDWVALTDAGITLDPRWLASLIARVEEDPTLDVVYGSYEPVISNLFDECAAIAYVPPPWTSPATGGKPLRGPTITSTLLRRTVWSAVGGFPPWRAAEDLIFMRRVEEAGFRIGYAPAAVVHWQLRSGLVATYRKFALYSRHNVRAGMQAGWHYGVARHYLVYLLAMTLAVATSGWFLFVPPLGYLARAGRRLLRCRRPESPQIIDYLRLFRPARLLLIMLILLVIDLATFAGWWRAVVPAGVEGRE